MRDGNTSLFMSSLVIAVLKAVCSPPPVTCVQVKQSSPWWLEVVQRAVRCSTDDELVSRIKNDLTSSYKQQASKLSMADKYTDQSYISTRCWLAAPRTAAHHSSVHVPVRNPDPVPLQVQGRCGSPAPPHLSDPGPDEEPEDGSGRREGAGGPGVERGHRGGHRLPPETPETSSKHVMYPFII